MSSLLAGWSLLSVLLLKGFTGWLTCFKPNLGSFNLHSSRTDEVNTNNADAESNTIDLNKSVVR